MTEREIFLAALENADPTDRAAFLDRACGTDIALRQRLRGLLHFHEQATDFMDVPVVDQLAADRVGLDFLAPPRRPDSRGSLGNYEILEVVGRGGMGVVFRAFDTKLHRVVAIKALAPQLATNGTARQRFVREARTAAAVTHDHVVAIHTVEDAGPVPYLVMQYIDGPSLQKKLDRTGQLSLKEILRISLQIAEGLAGAHRQGLVHRDVKPANILLENGIERVRLTDFGLARAIDDVELTREGVVAGTPPYMSPEQARGEPVDYRSDLFSLGSVMYTMCTGRTPFRAPGAMATLKRVCEETPQPIREVNPEVPPWLEELVGRLLAKAPADRFASTREVADLLAQRLAELQSGGALAAPAPAPPVKLAEKKPARTPRAWLRSRWRMAAAGLLLLLAGLGLSEATGVTEVRSTIIRLFSPEGTLVVEVDDPGVSVSLNGEELVITGAGVREIRLKPGRYEMKATKEGKLIRQELVTVSRDGRQVVRLDREPPAAKAVARTAESERTVAALAAEEQVKAVGTRLKDLNPGFDGKLEPEISNGVVTALKFSTEQVTDVAPVRALSNLRVLDISGHPGKLADLFPLKGLSLSRLVCNGNPVSDLSPLQGMPLIWLEVTGTEVSDLTPLKGLPLRQLFCACPHVSDLSPLRGMRLTSLDLADSDVKDLSPLEEMPLAVLHLYRASRLTDLSPLKRMPLEDLNLGYTQVADLSPLADMKVMRILTLDGTPVADLSVVKRLPLNSLRIESTSIADLAPLKELPLKQLWFTYSPSPNADIIRSLKGLEQINGQPAAGFWKAQQK